MAAANSDVLIPFASIDPAKGKIGCARGAAARPRIRRRRASSSTRPMQGFYPNDRSAYVLYEAIAEVGAIALFHTGQTGVGSGMPGGTGMRLKYSNPMYHRRRGRGFSGHADHPRAPLVSVAGGGACRSRPTSPTSTSIFPAGRRNIFRRFLCATPTTLLREKVLFGSDWPMIAAGSLAGDFEKIDIKDVNRPLILKQNAARLLGLG